MLALLVLAVLQAATPSHQHDLVLSDVGRFAVFADRASLDRQDGQATVRSFQVAEAGFQAAGRAYAGGWSNWRFDCAAGTWDRLDFAAVDEAGVEGPATPDGAPPSPVEPGSAAEGLFGLACGPANEDAGATLDETIRRGRVLLAEQANASTEE